MVLLVNLLYVVVQQTRNTHFAAAFVAESSRDLKSMLFSPNCLVDFDFLQGVICFSAAFCAEVLLIFHSSTLPSGFTFFFIIVFLPLFFVNNKAAASLPLAETINGSPFFKSPRHKKSAPAFQRVPILLPYSAL